MPDGCVSIIAMLKQHETFLVVSYEGHLALESLRDGSGMYRSRKKCLIGIEQDQ